MLRRFAVVRSKFPIIIFMSHPAISTVTGIIDIIRTSVVTRFLFVQFS